MNKEITEKFTQFVKWSIDFYTKCNQEPEKYGYTQFWKLVETDWLCLDYSYC